MYVWPLWVAGMSVGKPQGVGQTATHNHWPKADLARQLQAPHTRPGDHVIY